MAVLQQANTNLAQKQVSNATPAYAQNQSAVQVQNQNGEAIIKAVQDAIGVGADIYQKMEAASLDLEYKEAKADMFMHNQDMVAQREIGLETSTAQQLDPKSFDKNYSTGEAKLGDKSFKRYEPSKDLSPQVLDRLQIDIDSYNNGFVRETQIMLAKKMVQKGKENLDISSKANIAEWQSTLTEMPIDMDNGIMASTVLLNHKESAGDLIIKMETELENAVIHRTISPEESTKRLNDFKKGLANDMFVRYADQDPDIAQDLYNEGSITIGGVAVDPGVAGKWLDAKMLSDETKIERDAKVTFETNFEFEARQKPTDFLDNYAIKNKKNGSYDDRALTKEERKSGITQELVQKTILIAERQQSTDEKAKITANNKEQAIIVKAAKKGEEHYVTKIQSLLNADDPSVANQYKHAYYDVNDKGILAPKKHVVDGIMKFYNQTDRQHVINVLTEMGTKLKTTIPGAGLGQTGVEDYKQKLTQYYYTKTLYADKDPVHPQIEHKASYELMTQKEKDGVNILAGKLEEMKSFDSTYKTMKKEVFINTLETMVKTHRPNGMQTRTGNILDAKISDYKAWNASLNDPQAHCEIHIEGRGLEVTKENLAACKVSFGLPNDVLSNADLAQIVSYPKVTQTKNK